MKFVNQTLRRTSSRMFGKIERSEWWWTVSNKREARWKFIICCFALLSILLKDEKLKDFGWLMEESCFFFVLTFRRSYWVCHLAILLPNVPTICQKATELLNGFTTDKAVVSGSLNFIFLLFLLELLHPVVRLDGGTVHHISEGKSCFLPFSTLSTIESMSPVSSIWIGRDSLLDPLLLLLVRKSTGSGSSGGIGSKLSNICSVNKWKRWMELMPRTLIM